jgi:hypothetical protein
MATIWVKEFSGGLDTRRLPETSTGAVLIKADNVHITRGGEIEKRAAFVNAYNLNPNTHTIGLAYDRNTLVVFGSDVLTHSLPTGVTYQRLQHPNGITALSSVPSWDLYAGKIYAVGEFADGSRYHFYDGVRVTDLNDGRARASFQVVSGSVIAAASAKGSFEIVGGSSGVGNQIVSIKINGVEILSGAISFDTSTTVTASLVAASINSFTSSPDYTAVASGQTVTVTAVTLGSAINGKTIVVTANGNIVIGNVQPMSGGVDASASSLTTLKVDGVSIIGSTVSWATSNSNTAALIAAAVNAYTSSPDYTATAVGDVVNIIAGTAGTTFNGKTVSFTTANNLVLSPSSGLELAGGTQDLLVAGKFVKTIGSRMHAVSDSIEYGSGIGQPTRWTTDATGAYFIDMSTQSSGAEQLYAVNQYQSYVAVFGERVVQIWAIDADPLQSKLVQTLVNTGTVSGESVTQYGDSDLFYLDYSGIRSLKARDSSNAASTTDIGVPIDSEVVSKYLSLPIADKQKIFGLIEPADGRFWLIMKDEIYVFSYFQGVKISAWSKYIPNFNIEDAVVFNRKVYLRSQNKIYVYGGQNDVLQYDDSQAEVWLPFLDGGNPAQSKFFESLDLAVRGDWQVSVSYEYQDLTVYDDVSRAWESTFNRQKIPMKGVSTHVGMRFRSIGSTEAKLGSVLIHFTSTTESK